MALDPNSNAALEISDQAEYMQYLKNAPIAEFAAYIGKDIDTAVALRVEAAQAESTLQKMEVTARPIEPLGNLYGFASVKIGGVKIDDFKIVADKNGELFVGMPSKPDKTSNSGYRNTVSVGKDFKDDFNKKILAAHYDAVEVLMEKAEKMRSPESISSQVNKAKKEADKHNAELPPKKKSDKTRGDRE